MRQRLEARKLAMVSISASSKVLAEDAKKEEERLSMEVRSLLVAGTALSIASKQLQVILFSVSLVIIYLREIYLKLSKTLAKIFQL